MSAWRRLRIPAVESPDFVAHSVVASPDPSLVWMQLPVWDDLADEADPPPPEVAEWDLALAGHAKIPDELLQDWLEAANAADGEEGALVQLRRGTVWVVQCQGAPPGALFAGFARAGASWPMPAHRLPSARESKVALLAAEAHYSQVAAGDAEAVALAFAAMAESGYPRPGNSESDADVVALWEGCDAEKGELLAAAVVCHGMAPGGAVFVVVARPTALEGLPLLKALADLGRNAFRHDFLEARAVGVRRGERKATPPAEGAP